MTPAGPAALRGLALAWAGKCLLTPPSNFARFGSAYDLFVSLRVSEQHLGLVCVVTGVGGVVGAVVPWAWGRFLRCAGSVVGAALWSALTLAFYSVDPDLLSLGPVGAMALLCWRAIALEERS